MWYSCQDSILAPNLTSYDIRIPIVETIVHYRAILQEREELPPAFHEEQGKVLPALLSILPLPIP